MIPEMGSVELKGGDRVAFKDQQVEFQCRAPGWRPEPSLEWQVGNEKVRTFIIILILIITIPIIITITMIIIINNLRPLK